MIREKQVLDQLNKKAGKNEAMVIDDRDDVIEHKKDDSTAANLIKKNEAIQHTEVTEVTSVTDDRDDVIEHVNDECILYQNSIIFQNLMADFG